MPEIPTMSLKTMQFAPASFTPSQYEYQAADMGILERSLAQREARMKEAAQNKGAVDRALGEIELKLNPSDAEWFEGYKQDIRNQIQSSIDSGDYGEAIRTATYLADSIVQDPRIVGRIRSQEAYQKELQTQQARRDRREIGQNTFDWWISNNKHNYVDSIDGNGNYVESSPWQAKTRPVADINWAEHAMTAYKLITPKKTNISKSGGSSTTNVDGTGEGDKWNRKDNVEEITVEDILTNIDELLSATSDGYREAEQAYDVAMFDFNRLQEQYNSLSTDDPEKEKLGQQLDARKKLMYKNGAPIGYKEYYARMVTDNRYAHTLGYRWTTTDRGDFESNDYHVTGSGIGRPIGTVGTSGTAFPQPSPYGLWKGAPVRWKGTYDYSILDAACFRLSSRFGNSSSSGK